MFYLYRLRKVVSILFLLVLAFNFCGYRWLLIYLEQTAVVRLEQKVEAGQYDIDQLIEIKIPLHLPYYSDWTDYQACSGEIDIKGESFSYVKRKIYGDTLFLLCIPQTEKNKLSQAGLYCFNLVNDAAGNTRQSGHLPLSIKLMLTKFLNSKGAEGTFDYEIISLSLQTYREPFFSQHIPDSPSHPPEGWFV